MSYFRGKQYLWRDSNNNLHIWSETRDLGLYEDWRPGTAAQGIVLSQEVFDDLAVMRFAQLIEEGGLDAALARVKSNGNFGSACAAEMSDQLHSRLKSLQEKFDHARQT